NCGGNMQTTPIDKESSDRSVERLAREIGQVIQKARPEEREELRQMATDLLQEEMVRTQVPPEESPNIARRPLNPIALGGFILILGAGLSILVPPVGLILLGGGLAILVLGAMYRMVTK
ncbi:MAG TPA: hypothetical protein VE131_09615, partial [Terriglobales bacterium]|nr:hypothetical protein [Terriglobales bacterium]